MNYIISLPEGQMVRNTLENGLLEKISILDEDARFYILSPAADCEDYVSRWNIPQKTFHFPLMEYKMASWKKRISFIRRRLARWGLRAASRWLLGFEKKLSPGWYYYSFLKSIELPAAVLGTHIHWPTEAPLFWAARKAGIPSYGLVNSWDNVFKGIHSFPDRIGVWNDINRQELIRMEGLKNTTIDIIGPLSFDFHYREDELLSEQQLKNHFNLNPDRPYIVHATIGKYRPDFEESFHLDRLIHFCQSIPEENRPQIICRLHPWTPKGDFDEFVGHPDVRFSQFDRSMPNMSFSPTREDAILAASILKHARLLISPGSTMVLEASIFKTPALVPVYNDKQPEVWKEFFENACLPWHFKNLVENNWVNLCHSDSEFETLFFDLWNNPQKTNQQSSDLEVNYISYRDGKAVDRLAQQLVKLATRA